MRLPPELYSLRREILNKPIRASEILFKELGENEQYLTSDDRKIDCFARNKKGANCHNKPKILAYHGDVQRYCCDSEKCRKVSAQSIADEKNRTISLELK